MSESLETARTSPTGNSVAKDAMLVAIVAGIYYIVARSSLLLLIEPEGIAAIWPPEGVFLSTMLLARKSLKPWLAATLYFTDFAAELSADTPPAVSAVYSLALTGSAVLGSWLLLHIFKGPFYFSRGREVLAFLGISVLMVNSVMSLIAAWASMALPNPDFWTSWEQWAASDGVGSLIVTPLIMGWAGAIRHGDLRWNFRRFVEGAALCLSLALTGYFAFHEVTPFGEFSLILTYMAFPVLFWAAWRFGVPGATLASTLLAALAIGSAMEAHHPHANGVFHMEEIITVQLYVAILVLPALLLASLTTEMRQTYKSLREEMVHRRQAETGLQLHARRVDALLALNQMVDVPLKSITDFAMEAAIDLTGSKVGYVAFTNDDESVLTMHSWSREALAECRTAERPLSYPVVDTGLWGEAIRQRKAIITNDYQAPNPLKRGYPEGHVPIKRHMNVPVFDGRHIVLVAGVGNKEQPYTESDVSQLTLFMEGMWNLINKKNAIETIRKTNEDLRRSNQDLEQYAYAASHDLQEPLRMVTAFMDLLTKTYGRRLDDTGREYVGFAVEGAHRMQQLIGDLLAYSRVTTRGKEMQPISSQSALKRALADLRGVIVETSAEITHDKMPEVLGDETQIAQLLMNLLHNSLKFRGGRQPRIHIGASRRSHEWVFTVRDNGIGIEPQYFERIFQVFQRLHVREDYPGSGIGLAICKRIVERHGGRIWLESKVGEGTTFFFTLQAVPDSPKIESP